MSPTASPSRAKSDAGPNYITVLVDRERLPLGRQALSQPPVPDSQRDRILDAMAEVCAAKGYASTTIGDIVGLAGVSRATFYQLFEDKQACLLATMELALADAMDRIAAGYSPDRPWAVRVHDAAARLLDLLVQRPALTRVALVEAPAAGGKAREMYFTGRRVVEELLDRGRGEVAGARALPASAGRGAIAAVESLIVGQILAGDGESLPQLLPDVVYIVTVPDLGQGEALRQSRIAEESLRSRAA
jgi:AcrR family transcriptional regulator